METKAASTGAYNSGVDPAISEAAADAEANAWMTRCVGLMRKNQFHWEITDITPAKARLLLSRNPNNRTVTRAGVDRWAGALRRGEWQLNGESMIVANTGELNEGQHRCLAVVETGIPMKTAITFGATRESRETVDRTIPRNPGHVLSMIGVQNAHGVAATIKVILNMEDGIHLGTSRSGTEIKDGYLNHPGVDDAARKGRLLGAKLGIAGGVTSGLFYFMAKRHPEHAEEFFQLVTTGIGITEQTRGVALLLKRMEQNIKSKARMPVMEAAALVIKAFNSVVTKTPMRQLHWLQGHENPEKFPTIL